MTFCRNVISHVSGVQKITNKITATSAVVVYDYADEEEYTYQLVGSIGSDPEKGKITTESSLGAALLGKEVGNEKIFDYFGALCICPFCRICRQEGKGRTVCKIENLIQNR